jgi:hypothetical protein
MYVPLLVVLLVSKMILAKSACCAGVPNLVEKERGPDFINEFSFLKGINCNCLG